MMVGRTQTTDLEGSVADVIAMDCLAVRVRLLSRTITAIYDVALRPLGLTVGQMNVLVVVAKLGPISPGGVARRLNMEKSTLSRNAERMRAHGWLTVSPGETGRQQALEISRTGRKLLKRSLPLWKQAQSRAEALLGRRGAQSIHQAADAIWAQLGRS